MAQPINGNVLRINATRTRTSNSPLHMVTLTTNDFIVHPYDSCYGR